MAEYAHMYKEVKERLSEFRFNHTKGVIKRAIEYAIIYKIDEETVKKVALVHDIAKELTKEDIKNYINKYNIELDDIEKINDSLIHAKIGAYICKDKYNFTEDMVNAVKYHTTGRENMSLLEKIIYLADATEENRKQDFKDVVQIIKNNIDDGMIEVLKIGMYKLLKDNKIIHPDSIKCYNYYVGRENIERKLPKSM